MTKNENTACVALHNGEDLDRGVAVPAGREEYVADSEPGEQPVRPGDEEVADADVGWDRCSLRCEALIPVLGRGCAQTSADNFSRH
jgi:hypothetical protein